MYSQKRRIGNIGEDLAAQFLEDSGFIVLQRNYLKRFGEIDIIAQRKDLIHFVEVKSRVISRENHREMAKNSINIVSRLFSRISFTNNKFKIVISRESDDRVRPEENVNEQKGKRMVRVIEVFLSEKHLEDSDWQIDVISVLMDLEKKEAIIRYIENVVFD